MIPVDNTVVKFQGWSHAVSVVEVRILFFVDFQPFSKHYVNR